MILILKAMHSIPKYSSDCRQLRHSHELHCLIYPFGIAAAWAEPGGNTRTVSNWEISFDSMQDADELRVFGCAASRRKLYDVVHAL